MAQATATPAIGTVTPRRGTAPQPSAGTAAAAGADRQPVGGARRARRGPGYGLVLAGLVAVAFLALVWNGLTATASDASPQPPATASVAVVVGEGDTVWDLAREHVPAGVAVHDYVEAVVTANDLDARRIVPGGVLQLPQP